MQAVRSRKLALSGAASALVLVCALAVLGRVPDPAGAAGAATPTGKRLNRALDRVISAKNGPPGVAVLINRPGHSEFLKRGVASVPGAVKPTRRQHLRTASVSKAFNGGIVLRLAAKHRLRLRDRLGKWVPNLLPRARRATVGQLLHHTAGLPEYIGTRRFVSLLKQNPLRYMGPRKLVGFVRNKPLDFRPGTRYHYSDTDNIVAGIIARKAAGRSYHRLLKQIGNRAGGLPGTWLPRNARMRKPLWRGYDIVPGKAPDDVTGLMNPALAWASGGVVSTMSDLGRYFRAYVGGRLFGPALIRAQRHWVKGSSGPPGPGVNSAGMSLFRYRTRCGTVFGHTGNYPGFRVFAASTANGRRSVVWVANAQITPDTPYPGSKHTSALMRRSQLAAVCHLLR